MDEPTTANPTDSRDASHSVGSDQKPDGSNVDDNGNRVAGRRSYFNAQTLAAVIVAMAGIVYAILQVYGAVTSNGTKTQRLENGLSIVQTSLPKIAQQIAAIPTSNPPAAPVIVQTKPGVAPNVIVTQQPAAPGKPGVPGAPGKPGQVKIITVTQSPTPAPTCANSLLGYCLAK